jgi:hypothetical protein
VADPAQTPSRDSECRGPAHSDVGIDDTWSGGAQPGLRGGRQMRGCKVVSVLVAVEKRAGWTGRVRLAVTPDFKRVRLHWVDGNDGPATVKCASFI